MCIMRCHSNVCKPCGPKIKAEKEERKHEWSSKTKSSARDLCARTGNVQVPLLIAPCTVTVRCKGYRYHRSVYQRITNPVHWMQNSVKVIA